MSERESHDFLGYFPHVCFKDFSLCSLETYNREITPYRRLINKNMIPAKKTSESSAIQLILSSECGSLMVITLGRVFRKAVDVNTGLNVN